MPRKNPQEEALASRPAPLVSAAAVRIQGFRIIRFIVKSE